MKNSFNFFSSTTGIVVTGLILGLIAVFLQFSGNPGNMGICVVCFNRDIAGAVGLHRAPIVQYLRPEIMGMVLGSLAAALCFGEYRARGGSAPAVRFLLGVIAAIGALVFLGCPWRVIMRLAGGDANALFGLAGLVVGIGLGTVFFRMGFSLGRSQSQSKASGLILPGIMLALVAVYLFNPPMEGQAQNGVLFYSLKGPGSMHAPFLLSLGAGLLVGFLAQRSRFCTMGAVRDVLLFNQWHLALGFLAMLAAALVANLAIGGFHPGFEGQPVAHTDGLWNFLGMVTAGLAFALAGGCPGRQLFKHGGHRPQRHAGRPGRPGRLPAHRFLQLQARCVMATLIDTCGLSCPQPVLMFLTAAKKQPEGPFSVLVDNEASRENVTRAARNSGFNVTESEENGIWRLEISRQA